MLKILSEAFGVSGAEDEVREIIKNEMLSLCDNVETDSMGNLICLKKGTKGYCNTIMLTAHMDEVGFIISGVTKEGYLRFKTVGGIDPRVLSAKKVIIGKNKTVGCIGDKPPHLEGKKKDKAASVKDLYIDIGAKDDDDALKYISIGDFACFDSEYKEFGDILIKGKALDDRIGCFILLDLAKNRYPHDVYFVFTVQEEIGCRGAGVATYSVKPDIAIVVEATTCSDVPETDEAGFSTKLRGGGAISILDRSSYSAPDLRNVLYKAAVSNGIKVQYKQTTFGGNDAGAIHLTETGIKTAVISVPCRYIHSPSCVASIGDINSVYDILDNFLKGEVNEAWSF
ncbi:MAG: putative aminopeptidase YsdC [Firmicutes bacterium ADurb.Bin193]|nr:MAG: putative aminopeptidase YsdC [Firmicutes bacterium ADurb.Bin193]